ncbi:protein trichome birefringence-like 42 [Phragmites australis]|uniref:protein trichome birefringence-like 42 n=1 Tax=Phragmites australis TaxID=29695 RepID=UPI002D765BE7|nr:protein trichome birefringence-like 42 [Phragmites australis]
MLPIAPTPPHRNRARTDAQPKPSHALLAFPVPGQSFSLCDQSTCYPKTWQEPEASLASVAMDSVKPAALSTSSKRRALATSLCSLACLFLLSAGLLLLAAGSRPFQAVAPQWDRFSKLAQPPTLPLDRGRHGEAVAAPAPDAGSGDPQEEDAGPPAPAPAPSEEGEDEEGCNMFDGKWVRDAAGYPVYEGAECPFLSDQVACRRNGRPDSDYEHWRWQPSGCGGRTRLGGAEALELCRNKRLVFVGDSLNRNMWEPLACILYTAVLDRSRTRIINDAGLEIFRAMDYNCSVEFIWSPFLVKLETKDDRTRALKLDQLPDTMPRTLGADVLVFNTGHWWTHTGKLRAWDHLERDGKMVDMAGEEAFNRALRTWARWVDHNVDRGRTRVFFRSISPEHKSVNGCYNQTSPISNGTVAPWFPKSLVSIVERNIKGMRTPVTYLNITHLSELRIDAHPSVYTVTRDGKPLNMEQRQQPITYADCSHWCLPGLPDTWNVLLLASLMTHPSNVQFLG